MATMSCKNFKATHNSLSTMSQTLIAMQQYEQKWVSVEQLDVAQKQVVTGCFVPESLHLQQPSGPKRPVTTCFHATSNCSTEAHFLFIILCLPACISTTNFTSKEVVRVLLKPPQGRICSKSLHSLIMMLHTLLTLQGQQMQKISQLTAMTPTYN